MFSVDPDHLREFHCAIGQAICAWQRVEGALAEIFGAAVQTPRFERLPYQIYYAGQSFKDHQLRMVDVAVRYWPLANEAFERWQALHTSCLKLYEKRNILAHWSATTITGGDPPKTEIVLWQAFDRLMLDMRRTHTRGNKGEGVAPREVTESKHAKMNNDFEEKYNAEQITGFAVEFDALTEGLRGFALKNWPPGAKA